MNNKFGRNPHFTEGQKTLINGGTFHVPGWKYLVSQPSSFLKLIWKFNTTQRKNNRSYRLEITWLRSTQTNMPWSEAKWSVFLITLTVSHRVPWCEYHLPKVLNFPSFFILRIVEVIHDYFIVIKVAKPLYINKTLRV